MSKHIATLNDENIVIGVQQALNDFALSGKQLLIERLDFQLMGKIYEDGEFKDVAVVKPVNKLITLGFFLLRLTQAERIAIRILATQQTEQGFVALDFMKLLETQTAINLQQPQVREGIEFLEQLTLLGEGRASVILDTPITDQERA